ncbi:hypothetical protein CK203_019091 [Vitis vinifera]|uniref:Uncharacterized protein n=1 Tax=Vitis vinifera TaxID=29760 RepID=A0A438IR10_VITVI|nr:hypothetical protein CK203_019091 [Vitis vinifera]
MKLLLLISLQEFQKLLLRKLNFFFKAGHVVANCYHCFDISFIGTTNQQQQNGGKRHQVYIASPGDSTNNSFRTRIKSSSKMNVKHCEVENKVFKVRFEGIHGGPWISFTERVPGHAFLVVFEEEEVASILEQLKKGMKVVGSLGFIWKYRECVKGRGWEALRKMISLVLECPFLTVTGTKEADAKVENKVGLVWRSGDQSCARVDEGCPRK